MNNSAADQELCEAIDLTISKPSPRTMDTGGLNEITSSDGNNSKRPSGRKPRMNAFQRLKLKYRLVLLRLFKGLWYGRW